MFRLANFVINSVKNTILSEKNVRNNTPFYSIVLVKLLVLLYATFDHHASHSKTKRKGEGTTHDASVRKPVVPPLNLKAQHCILLSLPK